VAHDIKNDPRDSNKLPPEAELRRPERDPGLCSLPRWAFALDKCESSWQPPAWTIWYSTQR